MVPQEQGEPCGANRMLLIGGLVLVAGMVAVMVAVAAGIS